MFNIYVLYILQCNKIKYRQKYILNNLFHSFPVIKHHFCKLLQHHLFRLEFTFSTKRLLRKHYLLVPLPNLNAIICKDLWDLNSCLVSNIKEIFFGGSTKISAKPLSQKVWFMGHFQKVGLNIKTYGCIQGV